MKGALVNIRKGTYGVGGTALTASNLFVFDSEVGGINSVFTYTTDGLVPAPTGSGTIRYLREDGTWGVPPDTDNDTWIALTGTVSGYVTTQGASDTTKYLNGNGQWSTPPDTDTVYTHPTLTARDSGLLTGAVVISRVTSDTNGHVTTVSTRTLTPADIGAALASHLHNASDINAGTLAIARIPTGTTSTTVALGDHTHPPKEVITSSDQGHEHNGDPSNYWWDFTNSLTGGVSLQLNSGAALQGYEMEGSYRGTVGLTITGGTGVTISVPDGYANEVVPNGVFGVKFIANNIGLLFGALKQI